MELVSGEPDGLVVCGRAGRGKQCVDYVLASGNGHDGNEKDNRETYIHKRRKVVLFPSSGSGHRANWLIDENDKRVSSGRRAIESNIFIPLPVLLISNPFFHFHLRSNPGAELNYRIDESEMERRNKSCAINPRLGSAASSIRPNEMKPGRAEGLGASFPWRSAGEQ